MDLMAGGVEGVSALLLALQDSSSRLSAGSSSSSAQARPSSRAWQTKARA